MRKFVLPLLMVLAFAGCGGDDDDGSASAPEATTTSSTSTTSTEVDPKTETLPDDGNGNGVETTTEPESQTGGAGDETPAETLALFTGRDGKVTPRVVRVPAFISVRVTLRGADATGYSLTLGDKTIRVSPGLSSASTRLAGLRPGAKVVAQATSGQGTDAGTVTISATAEPGP